MQSSVSPNTLSRSLSTDDLRKLIHKSLAGRLTGQIHVNFQKEKTLTLFVHLGKVGQFYIWDCRVSETFRRQHPELVTDRPPRTGPPPSMV